MSSWVALISHSPQHPKVSEQQDNSFGDHSLVSCVVILPTRKRNETETVHTGMQMHRGAFLSNTSKCVGLTTSQLGF